MKASKETICEAIRKNRGGHENTDVAGLLAIWESLDADTREQYLKSIEATTPAGSKTTKTRGQVETTD
jgi:hypothetical protein